MTVTPPPDTASIPAADPLPRRSWVRVYLQLTKARLSSLVILTTAAGFVLASDGGIDWALMAWAMLGTALSAGCANAFNQLWETRRDRLMHRTAGRPLPRGEMSPTHAFIFAMLLGLGGVSMLATLVNLAAAGLALATIVLYVLVYTPLKVRTSLNTVVGAVTGGIPPMIGWVAASGELAPGAWLLAALLFVWQLPHFLALAWLYRRDYSRGGFLMLPNIDPKGELTGLVSLAGALILVLIGLLAALSGLAGWIFAAGALIGGLWMTGRSMSFLADRTDGRARSLFRASLVYLTVVLLLLVADRGPAGALESGWQPQATLARAASTGPWTPEPMQVSRNASSR